MYTTSYCYIKVDFSDFGIFDTKKYYYFLRKYLKIEGKIRFYEEDSSIFVNNYRKVAEFLDFLKKQNLEEIQTSKIEEFVISQDN